MIVEVNHDYLMAFTWIVGICVGVGALAVLFTGVILVLCLCDSCCSVSVVYSKIENSHGIFDVDKESFLAMLRQWNVDYEEKL